MITKAHGAKVLLFSHGTGARPMSASVPLNGPWKEKRSFQTSATETIGSTEGTKISERQTLCERPSPASAQATTKARPSTGTTV